MNFTEKFKSTAAMSVLAVAGTLGGCASMPSPNQISVTKEQHIANAVGFYKRTGASPINYDACGALAKEMNTSSGAATAAATSGAGGFILGSALGKGNNKGQTASIVGLGAAVGGYLYGKADQDKRIQQYDYDCSAQQAIGNAAGVRVQPGVRVMQPGGIFAPGGRQ